MSRHVKRLEAKIDNLTVRVDSLELFVRVMAKQYPIKPDQPPYVDQPEGPPKPLGAHRLFEAPPAPEAPRDVKADKEAPRRTGKVDTAPGPAPAPVDKSERPPPRRDVQGAPA